MHTGLSQDISRYFFYVFDTNKNGLIQDMEVANTFKAFDYDRKLFIIDHPLCFFTSIVFVSIRFYKSVLLLKVVRLECCFKNQRLRSIVEIPLEGMILLVYLLTHYWNLICLPDDSIVTFQEYSNAMLYVSIFYLFLCNFQILFNLFN